MKRLALAALSVAALAAGCGSRNSTADAQAMAGPRPTLRLGSADDLGWRLYGSDRTIAGLGDPVGPTYVSHDE